MDALRRKTIHEAMVRLADGDRSAMNVLVNELWPVVLLFAERGLQHEQDAEDVAQEVFLRICSRISDFDRNLDGLSWAFGIANYEIMTVRTRRKRRRELAGDRELAARADARLSQEEAVIQSELTEAMVLAVGHLSDDDRASLALEVPRLANVPTATVRKRRQRALDRLRAVWRNLYGEP
jgi:RNA polymerase sigma-70 factor (ECF subfamily)